MSWIMLGSPPPFLRRSMITASVLARKFIAAMAVPPPYWAGEKPRRSRYPTLPASRSHLHKTVIVARVLAEKAQLALRLVIFFFGRRRRKEDAHVLVMADALEVTRQPLGKVLRPRRIRIGPFVL